MKRISSYVNKLGPGIITAALVFGPGSLTVNSKLGAAYGFDLLWVIIPATLFMVLFTQMAAKVGLSAKQSFIQLIRERYGKWVAYLVGLGVFLIAVSFQAGNAIGAGLAFGEMFEVSPLPFVWLSVCIAIALLFRQTFYKILENLMLLLVGLMFLSFLLTLLIVQPSSSAVINGYIPRVPSGSEFLTIALVASSFSVGGAFFQAYLVREKGWGQSDAPAALGDVKASIIIMGIISTLVLATAASVLAPTGTAVQSASDMGAALEPLYGKLTHVIFLFGLFAAAFSSMTGNATIGGAILADTLTGRSRFDEANVRAFIIALLVIGAGVASIFNGLPLELIVFASALTILVVPLVGIVIVLCANDEQLMGELHNRTWEKTLAVIGICILCILASTQAYLIFIA